MFLPLTTDEFLDRILVVKNQWKRSTIYYHAKVQHYKKHVREKKPVKNILVMGDAPVPKLREINEPCPALKWIQGYILRMVLDPATDQLMKCAHGCVPGRSTVTNAAPHVKSRWKIHMDLKDFFPTVTVQRVYGLFHKVFKYGPDLSWLLANLTQYEGKLPQGAPTSPAIANHVATPMDRHLVKLISKMGGYYTRYVDDLTFSFPRQMSDKNKTRFIKTVREIVERNGFVVNEDKTSIIGRGSKMTVTGIVVNAKTSTPRWFRRNIRAALHQRALGVPSADNDHVIGGKIAYVNMVCPEQANAFHLKTCQVDDCKKCYGLAMKSKNAS
ncbi:MAG: hypothetical protein GTN93_09625 [Anaerolineae bacterium]|nr:hypothetical protein [Anaerolineae bacterium]